MVKFKIGDKVRILDVKAIAGGEGLESGEVYEVVALQKARDGYLENAVVVVDAFSTPLPIVESEYHAIELVESKSTKKARIEALEKDVARQEMEIEELRAKVEAFEQKSKSVDELYAYLFDEKAKLVESTFERLPLTANQRRAMIIADAKDFIEQTIEDASGGRDRIVVPCPRFINNPWVCREIKFEVNAEKRTVVALAIGYSGGEAVEKAIAKCAPDDVFNTHIGKAIAVGRLFDLDVERFVNAVNPDKKVVGQIVEIEGNDHPYVDKVISGASQSFHDVANPKTPIAIIDDSEAQYE